MRIYPARHLNIVADGSKSKSVYTASELRKMEKKFKTGQLPRPMYLHNEHRTDANKHKNDGKVEVLGEIKNLYYNECDGWLWGTAEFYENVADEITEKIKNNILTGVSASYKISYNDIHLSEISLTENPDFKKASIQVLHSDTDSYELFWPLEYGPYPKQLFNKMSSPDQYSTQSSWAVDPTDDDLEQSDSSSSSSSSSSDETVEDKNRRLEELTRKVEEFEELFQKLEDEKQEQERQRLEQELRSRANKTFQVIYGSAQLPAEEKEKTIQRYMQNPELMEENLKVFNALKQQKQASSNVPPNMSTGQSSSSSSSSSSSPSLLERMRNIRATGGSHRTVKTVEHSAPGGSYQRPSGKRNQRIDANEKQDELNNPKCKLVCTGSGFTLGMTVEGTILDPPCVKEHSASSSKASHPVSLLDFAYSTGKREAVRQAMFHEARLRAGQQLRSKNEQERRDAKDQNEIMEKATRTPEGRLFMTCVAEALMKTPDMLTNSDANIYGYDKIDHSKLSLHEREIARYAMGIEQRLNLAHADPNVVRVNLLKLA